MSQEFQEYQKKLSKKTAFSEMLGYGFFLNDNTTRLQVIMIQETV